MFSQNEDYNEIGIVYGGEVVARLSCGAWRGNIGQFYGPGWEMRGYKALARRLCGSVFICTDYGESEVVRIRQAIPDINLLYPQMRWRNEYTGILYETPYEFDTPYEKDANRPAPFWMVVAHATDEFRKTMAPYIENDRMFLIDDDVFMLMKMRF